MFPTFVSQIQRNASNASQVTIEQVETNISGKFSCEVSAEPSFHTMIVSGGMEVVGQYFLNYIIPNVHFEAFCTIWILLD